MKLVTRVALSFGLAFLGLNGLLALIEARDIGVYVVLNCIVYFVLAWIHITLNPKTSRALNTGSAFFLAAFLVLLTFKIVQIVR